MAGRNEFLRSKDLRDSREQRPKECRTERLRGAKTDPTKDSAQKGWRDTGTDKTKRVRRERSLTTNKPG